MVLAGDHVRFIGSVEGTQALRVGNREGMVFPAHRTSGGVLLLADLPAEQFDAIYSDERWADRPDERPDRKALRREMRLARERGFAINNGRTETGVTAVGRAVRGADGLAEAAVSISLPTARYSRTVLPQLVAALAVTTADIERELAAALTLAVDRRLARRARAIPQPTSAAATTVSARPAIVTACSELRGLLRAPVRGGDVAGEQRGEDGAGDGDADAGGDLGGGVDERRADRGPVRRAGRGAR